MRLACSPAQRRRLPWEWTGVRGALLGLLVWGLVVWVVPVHLRAATKPAPGAKEKAKRPSVGRMTMKDWVANPSDAQGRQMLIRGDDAELLANGIWSVTNMVIETQRNGVRDISIRASQCFYDPAGKFAYSPGRLDLQSADGRLAVQGRGFRWQESDSRLTISNEVQTTVLKRRSGTNVSLALPAPVQADARETIRIESDRLNYRGDVAEFAGKVHAIEPEGRLDCATLRVYFTAGDGRFDRIEALESVVLQQGVTRATGDRAWYVVEGDGGYVEMLGNATWRDGVREGRAQRFKLDRGKQILTAEGEAQLELPRDNLNQASLAPVQRPLTSANEGEAAAAKVSVNAGRLTVWLPSTNGPVQRIEAEERVVLLSPQDRSRAQAQRVVYDQREGTLRMTGNPIWEADDRTIKGETLTWQQALQVFSVEGRAYLRIPVSALGRSSLVPQGQALLGTNAAVTARFLEVTSGRYHYRTNRLDFEESVHANLLEGEARRAELDCAHLQLRYGARLEQMSARGGVVVRHLPAAAPQGKRTTRRVQCEALTVQLDAEGRMREAVADGDVRGEQTDEIPGKGEPVSSRFRSGAITARFEGGNPQPADVVAKGGVVIEQGGRVARGDQAVYSGTTRVLELTGAPSATFPEGKILRAEALAWDWAGQRLFARGRFRSEWQRNRVSESLNLPPSPPAVSPQP